MTDSRKTNTNVLKRLARGCIALWVLAAPLFISHLGISRFELLRMILCPPEAALLERSALILQPVQA